MYLHDFLKMVLRKIRFLMHLIGLTWYNKGTFFGNTLKSLNIYDFVYGALARVKTGGLRCVSEARALSN